MPLRLVLFYLLSWLSHGVYALPNEFVYLHDIAPSIIEEMRYAGNNNFVGKPIPGYRQARCVLTRAAALKLKNVQTVALTRGYSLKVYDCYRPQMAVNAFYLWSEDPNDTRMKQWFYPHEPKNKLFNQGYIAQYSGHSRGSTVDITLVNMHQKQNAKSKQALFGASACPNPVKNDDRHPSIDMGTPFDCFDKSAHVFYNGLNHEQRKNRILLRHLMMQQGFIPYSKEWWHFSLSNEPYPHTYFNFPVQ